MQVVTFQPGPAGNPLKGVSKPNGEDGGAVPIPEYWALAVDCVALEKPIHFLVLPEGIEKQYRGRF